MRSADLISRWYGAAGKTNKQHKCERMDPMDLFGLERFAVKRTNGDLSHSSATTASRDVTGLEAMLDYAIVEGAQMRLPLFVCLLRLARMALKEESEELREQAPEAHS